MRALFKPEDGNVLLVRDADINESTLLRNFCNKVKNGAVIEVQERNTGVNDLLTGLVFTVTEAETPVDVPSYISIVSTVVNKTTELPLFSIDFKPENANYLQFKVDISKWALLKYDLEALGLTNVTLTSEGNIIASNDSLDIVRGVITVPKGLFQYVNKLDASVNNFSDITEIVLGD
jgi:hypothetical protein|nr:MAG TPA: protein of unknown function (DUF4925) [Caudoviricetes sp.]